MANFRSAFLSFGPSTSAAQKEFIAFVVGILSNKLIDYRDVRAERILLWLVEESGIDLQHLFGLELPAVFAASEFLLMTALHSLARTKPAGKTLLAADKQRRLFPGQSLKLLEFAVILKDEQLIHSLVRQGVLEGCLPIIDDMLINAMQ